MQYWKVNQPTKIDLRTTCMLETNMKKIFESNRQLNPIADPDAKIIFHDAPFIQYEQIRLNDNFRQYLETIMASETPLRISTQKTPLQISYEITIGSPSFTVDFRAANRQLNLLKISLVWDKSNKRNTVYNSFNVEKKTIFIQCVVLENILQSYSIAN